MSSQLATGSDRPAVEQPSDTTAAPSSVSAPAVAVIGAGYVGVPLAQVFVDAGSPVVLVDVMPDRVAAILRGESHIEDVSSEKLVEQNGRRLRP